MILILKRNGRRSFTEGSHLRKIKDIHKNRESYEPFICFKNKEKSKKDPDSPNSTTSSSDESFGSRD
jgi:hypothetical protein